MEIVNFQVLARCSYQTRSYAAELNFPDSQTFIICCDQIMYAESAGFFVTH